MKYTTTNIVAFTGVAMLALGASAFALTPKPANSPVIITPPAVHDGSNMSRAPFPAARPQNDVTPPDGLAFDENLPPNTRSTTPAPFATPPAAFAIMQPRTEPGLMPTGRPSTGAAITLDSPRVEPMIQNADFSTRDNLVDTIRVRMRASEDTVREFRRSEPQMSSEGRSQFDALNDEVKARQKALDRSVRAAANASAADWDSARAQLASDYDAYASALAKMDTAVGVQTVHTIQR